MRRCSRAVCSMAVAMSVACALDASPATAVPGWGPVVNLSPPRASTYVSDVAVSARGRVVALWQRGSDRRAQLYTSWRSSEGRWTDPSRVPGTRGVSEAAADFDASGALVVVWTSGRHVRALRRPAGGSWGTPVPVATTPSGSANGTYPGYLALAVNPQGRAAVAWETVDDDADGVYARSRVQIAVSGSGRGWGPAHTLSTRHRAVRPQVGIDDRGRVSVVWSEQFGRTHSRVMATASSSGSRWAPARALSRRNTDTGIPALAVTGSGRVAVAWGYGSRGLDGLQIRRWSPAGGWQPPVRAPAVSQSPAWVAAGMDAAGTVTVVFTARWRGAVRTLDQRPGGRWSALQTLAPAGGFDNGLALEVDSAGDAITGWTSVDGGDHPVLGAYRSARGGWTRAAVLSGARGDDFGPELGLTRAGGAVAVWAHLRNATANDRGRIQATSRRAP